MNIHDLYGKWINISDRTEIHPCLKKKIPAQCAAQCALQKI